MKGVGLALAAGLLAVGCAAEGRWVHAGLDPRARVLRYDPDTRAEEALYRAPNGAVLVPLAEGREVFKVTTPEGRSSLLFDGQVLLDRGDGSSMFRRFVRKIEANRVVVQPAGQVYGDLAAPAITVAYEPLALLRGEGGKPFTPPKSGQGAVVVLAGPHEGEAEYAGKVTAVRAIADGLGTVATVVPMASGQQKLEVRTRTDGLAYSAMLTIEPDVYLVLVLEVPEGPRK